MIYMTSAHRPLSVVGPGDSGVQSHSDLGDVNSIPVIAQRTKRAFFLCHERFNEASLPDTARLKHSKYTMICERCESVQALYVIPASSNLGRLPLVPVGASGTIPYSMRRDSVDYPGASCDKSENHLHPVGGSKW